jgi:ABC-2 type transport system ATP-binding protein
VRWLRDFLRAYAAGGRTVLVSSHVLAEVAQTVDHVLIIANGQLVIESPLEELTSRVGGSVRVRSPEASKLQEELQRAGIDVKLGDDGALRVSGATMERVGEVAFNAGVMLSELAQTGASLEEIFLELTAEGES